MKHRRCGMKQSLFRLHSFKVFVIAHHLFAVLMDFINITRIWEQLLFNIRWLIYYLWWSIANRNSHFSFFTSYERSECFIFGVKRKMLHSRMKWSCFIVRRFLWSILRRCRKIWSASCDAWSGTVCHEAKPDGFIPPFFCKKNGGRNGN